MVNGKVIRRTIGPDGQVTESYDNNVRELDLAMCFPIFEW